LKVKRKTTYQEKGGNSGTKKLPLNHHYYDYRLIKGAITAHKAASQKDGGKTQAGLWNP